MVPEQPHSTNVELCINRNVIRVKQNIPEEKIAMNDNGIVLKYTQGINSISFTKIVNFYLCLLSLITVNNGHNHASIPPVYVFLN